MVVLLVCNDYHAGSKAIEQDLKNMKKMCKYIDSDCFTVDKRNVTKQEIHYYLKCMADLRDKTKIVVYFSGHGGIKKERRFLKMDDNHDYFIDDMFKMFATEHLVDAEKLFVIDTCSTGSVTANVPIIQKNFHIMHACSDGEKTIACAKEGSLFTTILTECVLATPKGERLDFKEIRTQAKNQSKKQQHPKFEVTNDATSWPKLMRGVYN